LARYPIAGRRGTAWISDGVRIRRPDPAPAARAHAGAIPWRN
jgi:hypothetical protein